MNRRVAPGWVLALAVFAVVVVAVTAVLADRFGGPGLVPDDAPHLTATVDDLQGLAVRGDVLVRGVRAGSVSSIDRQGDRATVRLELDGEPVTVRRGATVRIGTKTLLGESYVDLDPGPVTAPALGDDAVLPASATLPAVELDEALRVLDRPARADLVASVEGAGEAAASPRAAAQVSDAAGRLREATGSLRRLTGALRGQEADISTAVRAGRAVVGEAAARDDAVRGLVRDADRVLRALTRRDGALRATAHAAPGLLEQATGALDAAAPLIREARAPVRDLRAAAPALAAALGELPPVADDLEVVLRRARPLRRAAEPALRDLRALLPAADDATKRLGPALGDLVTVARFVAARKDTVAAWFANTAALGKNGDAKGNWARFFITADPTTALSLPQGMATNAYTGPRDALSPQPHVRGGYPRLQRARP
ncbi:MlaD family protein [Conexibacter sp. SYSU D00693]|uniref:MlaD family protein n=1 Tax=Conexibacter sp. SYSU D00693 TaxID=2812560 RepID=UPI00196B0392|nr:MlaD family protein [Conexibacter sp. SYSU D00693]